MEDLIRYLKEAGLDTDAGFGYTGGKERYLSAIQRFFRDYEKNKNKLTGFLAEGDYHNYMIAVHALKSNSKMIGANELSKAFEEMELATKNNNIELITRKHNFVMEDYASLITTLSPVGSMEDLRAADEITGTEARVISLRLLEALDDFNFDLSKELVIILSGYPFRTTQKNLLNRAGEYIDDFLYDEAAEIIKKISSEIE